MIFYYMKNNRLLTLLFLTLLSCSLYAQKGYRGNVEFGSCFLIGDNYPYPPFYSNDAFIYYNVSTTHGYQFTPYFFIGAGVGFMGWKNAYGLENCPLFADARLNLSSKRWKPFIDCRIGIDLVNNSSLYISPSIGIQYSFTEKLGLFFKAGYINSAIEDDRFHSISLSLGIEF